MESLCCSELCHRATANLPLQPLGREAQDPISPHISPKLPGYRAEEKAQLENQLLPLSHSLKGHRQTALR